MRRLVHFLFGFGALLPVQIGRIASVALAGSAVLYNVAIAPALGLDRSYRRAGEGHFGGLTTYPLAVLVLAAFFPLPVAGGGWAVLAALDPAAAEAGSRWGGVRLPWNARKTIVGTLTGFLVGAAACFGVLLAGGAPRPFAPSLLAAGVGALAESVPLPIDDNLVVALAAACALLPWYG